MFGIKVSSLSRTGTLLMVALCSLHLTWATSLVSDDVGVKQKNAFTSSNLTERGQSMLRSFVTPAKGLGVAFQTDFPDDFPTGMTFPPVPYLSCVVACAAPDVVEKAKKCYDSFHQPTVNGTELCDYWYHTGQCCIDAACTCSGDESKKMSDDIYRVMKATGVCGDKVKPMSCTPATQATTASSNKTLWIILGVVGAVIVVIVVIGVVVCCCCMGAMSGKGGRSSNTRKNSKRRSKGGSKSKIQKASSKHRASSRASSRHTSRASSRPTSRASSRR